MSHEDRSRLEADSGGPSRERLLALRASDADRERAVARLRDAAADGRLTFDELAQRVEGAYAAATAAELEQLLGDLPVAGPPNEPPAASKQRRWNVAAMGGCARRGRWRPAPRAIALAIMGGVDLDLREATIEGDEIVITAVALMGGVRVIVPEGVEVDTAGFSLMGGNDYRPGTAPVRPGTPVVRVRGYALMGGIDVKAKRSRESLMFRGASGSEARLLDDQSGP